jgi:hypothetical protein
MTTSVPPTTRVEVPFSPQLGKSSRTVRDVTVVASSPGGSVELSEPPTTTIYIKRRKCNGNSTSTFSKIPHHIKRINYSVNASRTLFS